MPGARLGLHDAGEEVGAQPVGDEELPPVDHPAVTVAHGSGRDVGDVRARVGLGDRDRPDLVAGDRRAEPLLAQLVTAELAEGRCAHVGLHRDRHRQPAAPTPGELLDEDQAGREIAAGPAPLLRVVQAEEPELTTAAEHVVGEVAGLLPLVDVGAELLVHVAPNGFAQLVVLRGEDRVGGHSRHSGRCGPLDRHTGP